MKTYEQFREEAFENPKEGVRTIAQIEAQAAKEYAKQWVALAATEAGDDSRTVTQNANIIWKMKQEIDAQ